MLKRGNYLEKSEFKKNQEWKWKERMKIKLLHLPPQDIKQDWIYKVKQDIILGDPGSVSRVRRKSVTKVFKHGWKSPWVLTLTSPFLKWHLIGHKKYFVLLCLIGEQHLLSSLHLLVHDGYCLAILVWFINQGCACKGNFHFLLS